MEKEFRCMAFMSVFVMIVGCAFYIFDFYDSAIFTFLTGLALLAVYHAGLYNRGIIEDNTIASQKEIIERDKRQIHFMDAYISLLEDYIKEIKEGSNKAKSKNTKQ